MARLTWLPDILRDAQLNVVEHPGWKTRGKDGMRPRVLLLHHTATHWTTSDAAVLNVLVNGRPDLPGPLCQIGYTRSRQFIVIASGKANHAGAGQWMDANESVETIGIEAYNYGNSVPFPSREPWTPDQLEDLAVASAAVMNYLDRDQRYVCAHREWATPPGRKPDPSGIDMDAMRARVGQLLGGDMAFTPEEEQILKSVAAQGSFLVDLAKSIREPGPTTQTVGNSKSLLHVLEVHRLVAKGEVGNPGDDLSGADHLAIAARLLGQ